MIAPWAPMSQWLICTVFISAAVAECLGQEVPRAGETVLVEVVNLDVVVTDRQGKSVTGLSREDFALRVNGQSVPISHFDTHFRPAESTDAMQSPPPHPQVAATARPVTWLVYADLLRMPRTQRALALRQVERFLGRSMRAGDLLLVLCFDGDALRVLQRPTRDVRVAARAFQLLELRSAPSRQFLPYDVMAPQPWDIDEKVRQMRASIDALRGAVSIGGAIEGRIALLLVGGGFAFSALPLEHATRLAAEYDELLERLADRRITVYPIYAGEGRFAGPGADLPLSQEPGVGSDLPPDGGSIEQLSTMLSIAEETGGTLLMAASDLERRLSRVRSDLDGYYSLGFRPPPQSDRKRPLRIDIRPADPHLRVRHPAAVRLRTDDEIAADAGMASLLLDRAPENPWDVRVAAGKVRRRRDRKALVPVEIHVPFERVLLVRNADHLVGELKFHFTARGPAGHYAYVGTQALSLRLTESDVSRLQRDGIRYRMELLLAKGATQLAVTVADSFGRTGSTAVTTIAVR